MALGGRLSAAMAPWCSGWRRADSERPRLPTSCLAGSRFTLLCGLHAIYRYRSLKVGRGHSTGGCESTLDLLSAGWQADRALWRGDRLSTEERGAPEPDAPCGPVRRGPGVLARFVKVVLASRCEYVIIARLWVLIRDLSIMYSCDDTNINTGITKIAHQALANAQCERTTTRELNMNANEHKPPSKSAAINLPTSCNSCAQSQPCWLPTRHASPRFMIFGGAVPHWSDK